LPALSLEAGTRACSRHWAASTPGTRTRELHHRREAHSPGPHQAVGTVGAAPETEELLDSLSGSTSTNETVRAEVPPPNLRPALLPARRTALGHVSSHIPLSR